MTFPFPFIVPGGVGLAAINYAGRFGSTATGVITYAAAPIGAAHATRLVLAIVQIGHSIAANTNSVTIGGIIARKITSANYSHVTTGRVTAWIAAVPTGTTADVVVSSDPRSYTLINVWYAYNCGEHEYSWYTLQGDPITNLDFTNLPVKANGGFAAHAGGAVASRSWSQSWGGGEAIVEDYDSSADTGINHTLAGAHVLTTSSRLTDDFSMIYSNSDGIAGIVVSFGPLPGEYGISSLLCGFEGSDGATSYTEESRRAAVATFVGNAQIDTAQKPFGTSSLLLDGTGDYVTFPGSSYYRFYDGTTQYRFTIEGFARWNADPSATQALIALWTTAGNDRSWLLQRDGVNGELELIASIDGSTSVIGVTSTWNPTLNTWYHIAVDFDGTTYRLYVDGVMVGSSTTIRALNQSTGLLSLGATAAGGSPFNGWLKEWRIVRGKAVYANDGGFSPPSAAFARS